jgi:DNA-binding transcriptional LysR family regulator
VWGGTLEDSSFVARKLGVASGGYYASPRYLARRSEPESLEELAAHDLVTITKGHGTTEWRFWLGGKEKRVPIRPRLVVNDLELAARAAVAGLGIAPVPVSMAQPYIAKRKLVAVLAKWTPPGVDVHAVFPPGGSLVPKTRAFVEMLQGCFASHARSGSASGSKPR